MTLNHVSLKDSVEFLRLAYVGKLLEISGERFEVSARHENLSLRFIITSTEGSFLVQYSAFFEMIQPFPLELFENNVQMVWASFQYLRERS